MYVHDHTATDEAKPPRLGRRALEVERPPSSQNGAVGIRYLNEIAFTHLSRRHLRINEY